MAASKLHSLNMAASSTKAYVTSLMVVLLALVSFSEARDHLIGGKPDSWQIPSPHSDERFNRWASLTRFLVGDSLVWKYDGTKDSVLQVHKEHYGTCNTSSPIATHNDGNTVVKLDHSGPYYFISGAQGHCEKGQKIIVVVLSERHSRMGEVDSPAIAPSSNWNHRDLPPAHAPSSSAPAFFRGSLVATFALGVLSFLVMI